MTSRSPGAEEAFPLGEAARFSAVSIITTAVDFGLFNLLLHTDALPLLAANTTSYGAGIAVSYALNKRFTFPGAGRSRQARRITLFVALNVGGLWLNNASVAVAATVAGGSPLILNTAKLLAGAAMWVLKFATFRRWVYAR